MDPKTMKWPEAVFVTGIGTDVGKSYATGWLARSLMEAGENVITQKFVQTGCLEDSEDITIHRKIMGIGMQPADKLHITAPVIFTYPASPELAARIDGREFDLEAPAKATATLLNEYSHVLIEGAGGVMVPLKGEYLTIDYIRDHRLPTVVVVNGALGSINHALLTLDALHHRGIDVFAVVYNPHFDTDRTIADDCREYLQRWLASHFPSTAWIEMPA